MRPGTESLIPVNPHAERYGCNESHQVNVKATPSPRAVNHTPYNNSNQQAPDFIQQRFTFNAPSGGVCSCDNIAITALLWCDSHLGASSVQFTETNVNVQGGRE